MTFLRAACRRPFEGEEVVFAESVAARVAAALDLGEGPGVK